MSKIRHAPPDLRGFSMIEMMAALAVIGVGLAAIFQAMSGTAAADRRVEAREVAADLLGFKMAEFSTLNRAMEDQSGKFDPPFEQYQWMASMTPTALPGLFRLEVEISWQGRTIRRSLKAETLAPQR